MILVRIGSIHVSRLTVTRANLSYTHDLRYVSLRSRFDPTHSKTWVATEYGTRTSTIGGHTWPKDRTVNECYNVTPCYSTTSPDCKLPLDAEVLSTSYATRVVAFTLLHMNTGFDSALYWWVQDYGWSSLCFGLQARDGR